MDRQDSTESQEIGTQQENEVKGNGRIIALIPPSPGLNIRRMYTLTELSNFVENFQTNFFFLELNEEIKAESQQDERAKRDTAKWNRL